MAADRARDLTDRRDRTRELAQEADRLKFALNEIDTVEPQPGEDDALVADIRRLSELDTLREAAATAREVLSRRRGGAADCAKARPTAWEAPGPRSNRQVTRRWRCWPIRSAAR